MVGSKLPLSFLRDCQGANCLCLNCLTPQSPSILSLPLRQPPLLSSSLKGFQLSAERQEAAVASSSSPCGIQEISCSVPRLCFLQTHTSFILTTVSNFKRKSFFPPPRFCLVLWSWSLSILHLKGRPASEVREPWTRRGCQNRESTSDNFKTSVLPCMEIWVLRFHLGPKATRVDVYRIFQWLPYF